MASLSEIEIFLWIVMDKGVRDSLKGLTTAEAQMWV